MVSSMNHAHMLKSRPVTRLQFSVYFPDIDATSYDSVLPEIMHPIYKILCDHELYIVTSNAGEGASLCSSSSNKYFAHMKTDAPHFGDATQTVLKASPLLVRDESSDGVQWTSWTASFQMLQLGDNIKEMINPSSQKRHSKKESSIEDLASKAVGSIIQEALESGVAVETIDQYFAMEIPGAYFSMAGKELQTWADLSFIHKEMKQHLRKPGHLESKQEENHHNPGQHHVEGWVRAPQQHNPKHENQKTSDGKHHTPELYDEEGWGVQIAEEEHKLHKIPENEHAGKQHHTTKDKHNESTGQTHHKPEVYHEEGWGVQIAEEEHKVHKGPHQQLFHEEDIPVMGEAHNSHHHAPSHHHYDFPESLEQQGTSSSFGYASFGIFAAIVVLALFYMKMSKKQKPEIRRYNYEQVLLDPQEQIELEMRSKEVSYLRLDEP